MKCGNIIFTDFAMENLHDLVLMWRNSFEKAVGIKDPHSLEEQEKYFIDEVLQNNNVQVALLDDIVIGFIAASIETVAQLYIHVDYQNRGIGSVFLDWAKSKSNGTLYLYTFENNKTAQAFYQKKGFQIVERGFEKQWQLRDIKYKWQNEK